MDLKNFWVRWYSRDMGKFELNWPWWITGQSFEDNEEGTAPLYEVVCAGIMARDEDHARDIVINSHDDKSIDIEFSFVNERPADWMPEWPPSKEFLEKYT